MTLLRIISFLFLIEALNSTKQSKKRRRTFELEEPTLSAANTPTSDPVVEKRKTRSGSRTNTPIENGPGAKRHRRNTYDKSENATEGVHKRKRPKFIPQIEVHFPYLRNLKYFLGINNNERF